MDKENYELRLPDEAMTRSQAEVPQPTKQSISPSSLVPKLPKVKGLDFTVHVHFVEE